MGNKNEGVKSYENYVCPECWRPLGECKKDTLPYSLTFVDKGIQEHVRKLNAKGYVTTGSCEGHNNAGSCTHVFLRNKYNLPSLPDGFKLIRDGRCVATEYYSYNSDEEYEAIKEKRLSDLLLWIDELQVIKDCSFDHEFINVEYENSIKLAKKLSESITF